MKKIALVTEARKGLGLAWCHELAKAIDDSGKFFNFNGALHPW
jgi:hypothetical protein